MVTRTASSRQPSALLAGALLVVCSTSCDSSSKSADVSEAAPEVRPTDEPSGDDRLALGAEARGRLSTLRVSAHVGSVILRKQGASWVMDGERACTAPPSRIERALDNLAGLKAVPSGERPAGGDSFQLQIVAQIGDERAVYFDIADRNEHGDLVQLHDASTFRVRGLDRALWSPRPEDWCTEP